MYLCLKFLNMKNNVFIYLLKIGGMGSVSIDFSIKVEAVKMCPLFGFLWFSNNA